MSDKHNITINILPQDPGCWMFVTIATVFVMIFLVIMSEDNNRHELEMHKLNQASPAVRVEQ